MNRPDMRDYFKARIDYAVNGMMATSQARRPQGVRSIIGDVECENICVVMDDGSIYNWSGGRYAARKVNGCYAPLMPKPVKE